LDWQGPTLRNVVGIACDNDELNEAGLGHASDVPALHFAPLWSTNVRQRNAEYASWLNDARPDLVLVDVSAEITVLTRLSGVPCLFGSASGHPVCFVGATAYHQHHSVCNPPLNHFQAIVRNAKRFHQKWNIWPMESWLDAFAKQGLIDFDPDHQKLSIRKEPTLRMIQEAETQSPAAF
jgi:hypothetical protein